MAIWKQKTASATAGREGLLVLECRRQNQPEDFATGSGTEQARIPSNSSPPATQPGFGGAIGYAVSLGKIPLKMADIKVTTTVRLHKDDDGFHIDASLNCELAGVRPAASLVAACPGEHNLPNL